jgi:hypothetical protein
MGPIQLRGMGTRQLSEQLGLIPFVMALVWPLCQLSSFPEQLFYLPLVPSAVYNCHLFRGPHSIYQFEDFLPILDTFSSRVNECPFFI